jgi:anti-anti-sigma factor
MSESVTSEPVVVVLRGEIDLLARECTMAILAEAADRAVQTSADLVIDLADVSFMDSMGLACLAQLTVALRDHNGCIRLREPQRAVLRVLELAGFGPMIEES